MPRDWRAFRYQDGKVTSDGYCTDIYVQAMLNLLRISPRLIVLDADNLKIWTSSSGLIRIYIREERA